MALGRILRAVGTGLAAGVDTAVTRTVLQTVRLRRTRSRAESLGAEARIHLLAQLVARYDRPEHFAQPDGFFPRPAPVAPSERRVRALRRGGAVFDLSWDSAYQPFDAEVGERYLAHAPNRRCHARLITRGPGRPAVILVHGYLGGLLPVEERLWPMRWLLDRGLDPCLAVLPFHGARRGLGRSPSLPSSDPRRTVEGFRQAVLDLRALVGILEARGAPSVGVMAMSLGSYVAALLATVHSGLDFTVTLIPLVSVADFARDSGRFVGTPAQVAAQHAGLDAMLRVVSPLARPPTLHPERLLVVGGEGDRLTPLTHARQLARHFRTPLVTFSGGHILQLGRAEAMGHVGRLLDTIRSSAR